MGEDGNKRPAKRMPPWLSGALKKVGPRLRVLAPLALATLLLAAGAFLAWQAA